MKIEFEVPDEKYGEAVKILADAWNNGNVNELAKHEFLACLATDLDIVYDEGKIDDKTHLRLLKVVAPTWPGPHKLTKANRA